MRPLLLCSVLLSGCVTVQTVPEEGIRKDIPSSRIGSVRAGMTSREVAATMGEKTTIGYERTDPTAVAYTPVTVNNPYQKESLIQAGKTYDVFYYFTRVQKADGIISQDELTPLVFENDVLVGKGWDFLNKLKNQETAK